MSEAVQHLSRDPVMAGLIALGEPLTLNGSRKSTFEALARAVTYQQLSGKAAATIWGRFRALFPGPRFPKPEAVLALPDEALRAVGLSRAKAASIRDLAERARRRQLPTRAACAALADDAIVERLTAARGVGRWTAEMFLIFTLGREDVWPVGDLGVRRGYQLAHGHTALPTADELALAGRRWGPYRSYAALYLWKAADTLGKPTG